MLSAYFSGGCLFKKVDGQANADNILNNSDEIKKIADAMALYHEGPVTARLQEDANKLVATALAQSDKDKSIVNPDSVKQGAKVIGSITGALGIPGGGLLADAVLFLVSFLGVKKGAEKLGEFRDNRKSKNDEYEQLLADSEPEVANQIKKARA